MDVNIKLNLPNLRHVPATKKKKYMDLMNQRTLHS